jgi:hypothetical protein
MREIRTSGLMSGDVETERYSIATAPVLDSTALMIMSARDARGRASVRTLCQYSGSLCHVKSHHMKLKVTASFREGGWGATGGEGTACRRSNLFRRDGVASLRPYGEAWTGRSDSEGESDGPKRAPWRG